MHRKRALKICLEVQPSQSFILWYHLGNSGSKLQDPWLQYVMNKKIFKHSHFIISCWDEKMLVNISANTTRTRQNPSKRLKHMPTRKTWTPECLLQWNQRSKWSQEIVQILKEGELVCMVDDSVKRCENKIARAIQISKGGDSVVQSTRVKIAHGECNRPVVKLANLFDFQKGKPKQPEVMAHG